MHQKGIPTGSCVISDAEGNERGVCCAMGVCDVLYALLGGKAVACNQRSWRSFSERCA